MRAALHDRWDLDPAVTFLNHGSFGATPRAVLATQSALRAQMESEPVRFFVRELEPLLDAARARLADFVGADPEGVAFVPNATTGVNTALASCAFEPGDELLTTDHEYNACANALRATAARWGARVVVAPVPFPLRSAGEVLDTLRAHASPRTRLVLVDHVTSPTALVLPVEEIVADFRARGVDTLVDGAHAPGMVPLSLDALGAAFYTGNLHKWVCAPKGSAFLWASPARRASVRPLVISHGANSPREDRTRYRLEFDWVGTLDPTPWLCVPAALDAMGSLFHGGWAELRARNRDLALRARDTLCDALGIAPPAPDAMIGSMAAVPAHVRCPDVEADPLIDPLQEWLWRAHAIEVPVVPWGDGRLVRVSAQAYNDPAEYARLADALRGLQGELVPSSDSAARR